MTRRAFRIAVVVSTVLLSLTLLLFVAGFWLDPSDHRLSLGPRFHVGVWGRGGGWDTRLVLFNTQDGPYRGSIIGFVDEHGELQPPLERKVCFGDTAGIYYRYFRWSDRAVWSLMISLWIAAAAAASSSCMRSKASRVRM